MRIYTYSDSHTLTVFPWHVGKEKSSDCAAASLPQACGLIMPIDDSPIPLRQSSLQDARFRVQSACMKIFRAVSNRQANHLTLVILLGNNMPEEFALEKLSRI